MMSFARQTGATLIAEGIETASERATLIALGFRLGQGYLLGKPMPCEDFIDVASAGPPVSGRMMAP